MRAARVAAQAKINLYLRVLTGPDPSGYHLLSTMFQRIDLADDVTVRVGGTERSLRISGPRMPAGGLGPPEKNLAFRAALAYDENSRPKFAKGFSIDITKHIPVGGGLGGGSADAGAVLRALDALAPEPMDPALLLHVARLLGADVPYLTTEFVRATGLGRGDVVTEFKVRVGPEIPQANVLLVAPAFGIPTADAYRWLDESRPGPLPPQSSGPAAVGIAVRASGWEELCTHNDFESVVEKRFPLLREIRERLVATGASAARLSGSGSTVFGIFEGRAPSADQLGLDADVIATRTSGRVVPVEVLE